MLLFVLRLLMIRILDFIAMSDALSLNDFYCQDFHVLLVKGFRACAYLIFGLVLINLCGFILSANSVCSSALSHSLCDGLLLTYLLAPHDAFCCLNHQVFPNLDVSSFACEVINAAKQDGPSCGKVYYLSLVSQVVTFGDSAAQIMNIAYLINPFPVEDLSKLILERHPVSKTKAAGQL